MSAEGPGFNPRWRLNFLPYFANLPVQNVLQPCQLQQCQGCAICAGSSGFGAHPGPSPPSHAPRALLARRTALPLCRWAADGARVSSLPACLGRARAATLPSLPGLAVAACFTAGSVPCPYFRYNSPLGLMDKASDLQSEDCGLESRRGCIYMTSTLSVIAAAAHRER